MKKYISTIKTTNDILNRFNIKAKKKFGQNFIIEPKIVEAIADTAIVSNDCIAIEIGPGIGALTEQLSIKCHKVVCYEIDSSLADILDYSLKDYDNIEIIFNDFLDIDIKDKLIEMKQLDKDVIVAANLPYYITTPILFKLFEYTNYLSKITVMVQREVADRFTAEKNTKNYNALSLIVQYLFDTKLAMKISPNIFIPKPSVDSAVVTFTPKPNCSYKDNIEFFEFLKLCFVQRRKTLYNNLRNKYNQEFRSKLLQEMGYTLNVRAQELDLSQFILLYKEVVK